jgi:exosortase
MKSSALDIFSLRIPRVFGRNGWRWSDFGISLGLAVIAALATADAWRDILRISLKDQEASHAFLVPFVAAWIFWVRRGRLRRCRPVSRWIGPAMVFVGSVFYVVGDIYYVQLFWHGGALLILVGAFLTGLGLDMLRNFLPLFLVLCFALPVPGTYRQKVAIPLQQLTARITQDVCNFASLPVERSGNVLRLNGVDVEIGEACNGMRMVFAILLVSFAFAMTTPLRPFVRILIVLLCPLSAVICNVVRLIPTLWVYGNSSQRTAQLFHEVSGWVMLFIAFMLLLSVIRLLKWLTISISPFVLADQ